MTDKSQIAENTYSKTDLGRYYCQRTLVDISRPSSKLSQLDLLTLAKKAGQHTLANDIMILADPGDGSTTLVSEIRDSIENTATVDTFWIHTDERQPPRMPYILQSLYGQSLDFFWVKVRTRWDSLRAAQRWGLVGCWILVLLVAHLISGFLETWKSGNLVNLDLLSLIEFQSIATFILATLVSLSFPALVITLWNRTFPSLERDDPSGRDSIIQMIRGNNFKALYRKVERSVIKKHGPILVIIDSIDDLSPDFDIPFLKEFLNTYRSGGVKTTVVSVSKFPSKNRNELIGVLQSPKFLELQNPTRDQLLAFGVKDPLPNMVIREALGESVEVDSLSKVDAHMREYIELHDNGGWSEWSLLAMIASSPYINHIKFSKRTLRDVFVEKSELIARLSHQLSMSDTLTKEKLEGTIDDFFNSGVEAMLANDSGSDYYSLVPLYQRRISRLSAVQWRLIGTIVWIEYLWKEYTDKHDERLLHWLHDLIRRILLETESCKASILNIILSQPCFRDLLVGLHASFHGSLCRDLAVVHLLSRAEKYDEVTDTDLLALEAFILYGHSTRPELETLVRVQSKISRLFLYTDLLTKAIASLTEEYLPAFKSIGLEFASTKPHYRPFIGWLSYEAARIHFSMPLFALRNFNREENPLVSSLPRPAQAGGFNFSTAWSLAALSNACSCRDVIRLLETWKTLAKGVQFVLANTPVESSRWDSLWLRMVFAISLCELVSFLADQTEYGVSDSEGFRHNIPTKILDDHSLELLNELLNEFNIRVRVSKAGYLPVGLVRQLANMIDQLRLELLLLDAKPLATILSFYHVKLLISAKDLDVGSNNERDEVTVDLKVLCNTQPPLLKITLGLEALLMRYGMDAKVHHDITIGIIEAVLSNIQSLGCDEKSFDELYDSFVDHLRLTENKRAAIHLKLRKHKRIKAGKSDMAPLSKAGFYVILANDLSNIGKDNAARICWKTGKYYMDMWSGLPNNEYRDLEMLFFDQRIETWGVFGNEDEISLIRFLKSEEYITAEGYGIFSLVTSALIRLGDSSLDLVENVLKQRGEKGDSFTGYKRAVILRLLIHRIECCISQTTKDHLISLALRAFDQLCASDQTQIPLVDSVSALVVFVHELIKAKQDHDAKKVRSYTDELVGRELLAIYRQATTAWMISGSYGAIVDAYYRILKHDVDRLLPADTIRWMADPNSQGGKEGGVEILQRYLAGNKAELWMSIPIIRIMNYMAVSQRDHQLQQFIRDVWNQMDLETVVGMNAALRASKNVSDALKLSLASHRFV